MYDYNLNQTGNETAREALSAILPHGRQIEAVTAVPGFHFVWDVQSTVHGDTGTLPPTPDAMYKHIVANNGRLTFHTDSCFAAVVALLALRRRDDDSVRQVCVVADARPLSNFTDYSLRQAMRDILFWIASAVPSPCVQYPGGANEQPLTGKRAQQTFQILADLVGVRRNT